MPNSLKSVIDCVLFDLDGTLVDTACDFQQVLDRMMDETGLERIDPLLVHQNVSDGARALVRLAFGLQEGETGFDEKLSRLLDYYDEQLAHTDARLYPGLEELLANLEAVKIPWGIVTNKPEKYSMRLLENLQLDTRCQCLVCPEHVTNRKPDPEPIIHACQQLSVNIERTVYVGDHLRDMQAAKSASAIAVAAQYGYLNPNTRIEDWPADHIAASAADLEPILYGLLTSGVGE